MEDGAEDAEGAYRWRDRSYRLEEVESEQWGVYDSGTFLICTTASPFSDPASDNGARGN